jgi:hypothetical protein
MAHHSNKSRLQGVRLKAKGQGAALLVEIVQIVQVVEAVEIVT